MESVNRNTIDNSTDAIPARLSHRSAAVPKEGAASDSNFVRVEAPDRLPAVWPREGCAGS
jgi:hypothetical protein